MNSPNPHDQNPQQLPNPSPRPPAGGAHPALQQLQQFNPNQPRVTAQAQAVGRIPGVFQWEDKHKAAKDELKTRLAHVVAAQAASLGAADPNIVGIGIGLKFVEGRLTGQIVVKVLVVKKLPPSKVPGGAMIPEDVNGVPTDVHQVGRICAHAFGRVPRPVPCGSEIGPAAANEAGTLGCLVTANDKLYILSNNHVLANVDQLKPGAHILQPSSEGQDPGDLIGTLEAGFPRIDFSLGADNRVDAALVLTSWADDFNLVDPTFVGGVVMSEDAAEAALGLNVHKIGMRTDHTFGQVIGVSMDNVPMTYDTGTANFNGLVMVQGQGGSFSNAGDSGSMIMTTGTNQPVALLMGGGESGTFGCPVGAVAAALGIDRFVGSKP